jgi:intraflagellar transport protein 52
MRARYCLKRSSYLLPHSNKDEVSRDRLAEADLVVFGGPREPFTTAEFDELKSWLQGGGRAMVMVGDGGEKMSGTNMNYLLEE